MSPLLNSYFNRALEELSRKSLRDVQRETALVWCGRACAAKRMGLITDAHEYAHEALEHAALTPNGDLLEIVRQALAEHQIDY